MATSSATTSTMPNRLARCRRIALAVFRGWLAEVLTVKLVQPAEIAPAPGSLTVLRGMVASQVQWSHRGACGG